MIYKVRALVFVFALFAATQLRDAHAADVYTYQLLPGSTITPTNGPDQLGPSEPLTGTFQWTQEMPDAFNAVSLNLSSPSYTFTLRLPIQNEYQSSLFSFSNGTFFAESVDVGGVLAPVLSAPTLYSFLQGTYEGPADHPTKVTYPGVHLISSSGGASQATISFSAIAVPEPSTFAAAIVGLLCLARYARFAATRSLSAGEQ